MSKSTTAIARCRSCLIFSVVVVGDLSNGGARRDRTDDLMLAKHALSQLSYGPGYRDKALVALRWWAWEDLNFRPHAYQARALTSAAPSRMRHRPAVRAPGGKNHDGKRKGNEGGGKAPFCSERRCW